MVRNFKLKNAKIVLMAVIMIASGLTVATFVHEYNKSESGENIAAFLEDGASLAISSLHQSATKDGREQWSLDALSARFITDRNLAVFESPSVIFFPKEERKVFVTANEGSLKTESNDIDVSGNVLITEGDISLKTENMRYNHDKQTFSSKVPVKITGSDFRLDADSILIDLTTRTSMLKGNVKGTFSENFKL